MPHDNKGLTCQLRDLHHEQPDGLRVVTPGLLVPPPKSTRGGDIAPQHRQTPTSGIAAAPPWGGGRWSSWPPVAMGSCRTAWSTVQWRSNMSLSAARCTQCDNGRRWASIVLLPAHHQLIVSAHAPTATCARRPSLCLNFMEQAPPVIKLLISPIMRGMATLSRGITGTMSHHVQATMDSHTPTRGG